MDRGADPNAKPGTSLNNEAARRSITTFKFLLEHGARLQDSLLLHTAAGADADAERLPMLAYLLGLAGIDVNASDASSGSYAQGPPINHAIALRGYQKMACLIKGGPVVDSMTIVQAERYGVPKDVMDKLIECTIP